MKNRLGFLIGYITILLFLFVFKCSPTTTKKNNFIQFDKRLHNNNANTFCPMSEIFREFKDVGNVGIITLPDGSQKEVQFNLTRDNYGYFNIAQYLGEIRNIDDYKYENLNRMFVSFGVPILKGKYKKEIKLRIEDYDLWMPIQDTLLHYWPSEVNDEDNVIVYFKIWGAINESPDSKWLLLIHDFNSNVNDGLWDEAMNKFQSGDIQMGEDIINKSIELFPNDGRNYSVLAYNFTIKGNSIPSPQNDSLYLLAEKYFKKSTHLTPDYDYQYFQWAILKFYKNEYALAWELIDKAKELGSTDLDQNMITDLENKYPYSKYLQEKEAQQEK